MKISELKKFKKHTMRAFLVCDEQGNSFVELSIGKPEESRAILAEQLKVRVIKKGLEIPCVSKNPKRLIEFGKACSMQAFAVFQVKTMEPESIERVEVSFAGRNYKFNLKKYEHVISE